MALPILSEQLSTFELSGLFDAASQIVVGLNDSEEGLCYAQLLFPPKTRFVLHGLASKSENLTIVEVAKIASSNPSALIFYGHGKGISHPADSDYGNNVSAPWRRGMMQDLVWNWRECVSELEHGPYDIVCSRWLWNMGWDHSQHIPAGNFLWAKASFVASLPNIYLRERIKVSGIGSIESRYESEVFWGNGRRPIVREMRPGGGGGIP